MASCCHTSSAELLLTRYLEGASLGIGLTYFQDCPTSYQPKGFTDAAGVSGADGIDWLQSLETDCHALATFEVPGFHVELTSDQPLTSKAEISELPVASEDLRMRDQLRLLAKSSSQPSHLIPTQATNAEFRPRLGFDKNRALVLPPAKFPHNPFDARTVPMPRKSLLTPANLALQSSNKPSFALGVHFRNRRQRNVEPKKLAEAIIQAWAMENFSNSSKSIFNPRKLKNGQIERMKDVTEVRCDCGSDRKIQDMVSPNALCSMCLHAPCSFAAPTR